MTPMRVSPVNIWGGHTQAHSVSELPVDVASTFLGGVSHDDWPHHFMPVIGCPSHQVHMLGPNGSPDFWKVTESEGREWGPPTT